MKLDPLRNIPGMVASVLVGDDGLPIDMIGEGGDALAAELASLRTWLDRTTQRMGAGRVSRVAFTTERMEIVAVASGHYVLGSAVTRGHDTRPVQQALARLALDVAELPEGGDA